MSIALVAMLSGLFVVPALLLGVSHRLRKRSARVQSAFWGAIVAHIFSALAAIIFGMIPPESWTADDFWRGAFGFWAMLFLPIIGAALGFWRAERAPAS